MNENKVFPSYITWHNFVCLVLLTLLGLIVSFSASFFIPKTYTATTKIHINVYEGEQLNLSEGEHQTSLNLANSYSCYLTEDFLLEAAYDAAPDNVRAKYTLPQFSDMISSYLVRGTSAVYVRATCRDSADAAEICNFYAEFAMNYIKNLTRSGVYTVYDTANAESAVLAPGANVFIILGMALGLLFTLVYLAAERRLNLTVSSEEDFLQISPDIPLVASIPAIKGNGATKKLLTKAETSIEDILVQNGVYVSYTKGASMLPLIRQNRDAVVLVSPDRPLRKNDIVLFKRSGGEYVLHRIIGIKGTDYILRGDHQLIKETVSRSQIIAYAAGVYRDDKYMPASSFRHRLYILVWVKNVPLRAIQNFVKRCYGKFVRTFVPKK